MNQDELDFLADITTEVTVRAGCIHLGYQRQKGDFAYRSVIFGQPFSPLWLPKNPKKGGACLKATREIESALETCDKDEKLNFVCAVYDQIPFETRG